MNLDQLQERLFSIARAHPPTDAVPLAFEKRIIARLQARPAPDASSLWAAALWRAAGPCVALVVLLAALFLLIPGGHSQGTDLSQDFENTVLAAGLDQPSTEAVQ